MNPALLTIGYSNSSIENFIELLKAFEVEIICDVRSHPYSKIRPEYSREALRTSLNAHGIKYAFFGDALGARPKAAVYVDGKAEYRLIARQKFFVDGLDRIRVGAKEHRIALMCAERDPIECHRSVLVCRNLPDLVDRTFHIHHAGPLESQAELERRLVRMLGLEPPPLLDTQLDWSRAIDEAFTKQASRIAYVEKPHSSTSKSG